MSMNQLSLFGQSTSVQININESHELLRIEKMIDWEILIDIAREVRSSKVKSNAGRYPHYRELLGAVVLMAIKSVTYRDAEDLISHYAPARYLCNLTDSDWSMDHVTIFDFIQLLGKEGMVKINKYILEIATVHGLCDPTILMSDTTAQEARIPYPTEIGLMGAYFGKVKKLIEKLGKKFTEVKKKITEKEIEVKSLIRSSHLFAKTISDKRKVGKKLLVLINDIHQNIKDTLESGRKTKNKTCQKLRNLNKTMDTLIDQIWYFTETGSVASKKIIHLGMEELYSIVRGKAGKRVEFGLKWAINRLHGGFLQGFLIEDGKHCSDKRFCLEAINVHQQTFGTPPSVYSFDRGGYSNRNVKRIQKLGVEHVGIFPKGKEKWAVSEEAKKFVVKERARVEASIGTIKSHRYGFNKPNAHKLESMKSCGHKAILGFNIRKLMKEIINLEMTASNQA